MSKFSSNRKCQMENLETRQMMAGDMVAYTFNGDLFIHESPTQVGKDNHVQVSMPTAGTIRVTGAKNADGTTSLIGDGANKNFAAFKNFNINSFRNVFITTAGGNDKVEFLPTVQSVGGQSNVKINGALSIDTSSPNAAANSDKDVVWLTSVFTGQGLTIKTGAGDDLVGLDRVTASLGVLPADTVIETGAGADTVDVHNLSFFNGNVRISTFSSELENDLDKVFLDNSTFSRSTSVLTGGGQDTIQVTKVDGRDLDIISGSGADTVNITNVTIDNVFAGLGAGADVLSVSNVKTKTGIRADAGIDYDTLFLPAFSINGSDTFASKMGFEETKIAAVRRI